jgi:hypothetical protein
VTRYLATSAIPHMHSHSVELRLSVLSPRPTAADRHRVAPEPEIGSCGWCTNSIDGRRFLTTNPALPNDSAPACCQHVRDSPLNMSKARLNMSKARRLDQIVPGR